MSRFRVVTFVVIATLIIVLAPSAAGAAGIGGKPSSTSEVDFGDCTELATGTIAALSELPDRVPDEVPVLRLTDQGIVFPGSDDLGVVITRVLECTGVIPLAACEPSVVPFIGNWWSVQDGDASVLSNNIAGQSAIFLTPADATITIVPSRKSQLADVFGAGSATAAAFWFSGFIPENPDSTEIITHAGPVGAPAD